MVRQYLIPMVMMKSIDEQKPRRAWPGNSRGQRRSTVHPQELEAETRMELLSSVSLESLFTAANVAIEDNKIWPIHRTEYN